MSSKAKRNRRRKAQQRANAGRAVSAVGTGVVKGKAKEPTVRVASAGQTNAQDKGQPAQNQNLSSSEVSKIVWPMVLVLGMLLVVCACFAVQYYATKELPKATVSKEVSGEETTTIADRILFVSKHYEVHSQTEESVRYSGVDDEEGKLGLLIVDDLGVYQTMESAAERAQSVVTEECVEIPVTDTTSPVYKQKLVAYEVKTDWVCMSVYYYYDESSKRLYSLTYSNEPDYYEESLARATKELLSIRFE